METNKPSLLEECKIGLNIPLEDSADFDPVINQKIRVVKASMIKAGVTSERMESDLAIGVIVMGVSDLWELKSGEVRFSTAFNTLLSQLALG